MKPLSNSESKLEFERSSSVPSANSARPSIASRARSASRRSSSASSSSRDSFTSSISSVSSGSSGRRSSPRIRKIGGERGGTIVGSGAVRKPCRASARVLMSACMSSLSCRATNSLSWSDGMMVYLRKTCMTVASAGNLTVPSAFIFMCRRISVMNMSSIWLMSAVLFIRSMSAALLTAASNVGSLSYKSEMKLR